ncbi:MFS transporter [Caulobacter endophyticus]|uniref:MFS transporter n=1 Tax=Caulobacter endophyticus TaxID=2172652 RepID=A0A2T9JKW5_9CAUL|nr:MFS transporter [Caulobacter endophyticus]
MSEVLDGAPARLGAESKPARKPITRGGWSWVLHQGSRDVYVVLVTIYIFAPYFSGVLVGDPVRGQAIMAQIATTYGLIVALTAPILGAAVEKYGPRKPLAATLLTLMLPMLIVLWWATPAGGLPLGATAGALIVLGVAYNWGDVAANSLLPRAAAEPGQASLLSGLGYVFSNGLSVLMLILMLWGFVLPGQVDWPGIPEAPLLGLSTNHHEPSRLAGPLSALIMALGAIPFLLWTPDAPRTGQSLGGALKAGLALLRDTFANLRGHRDVATFLAARMLYCDGMTALLVFGGLFAAGVMGWGALEMLVYGVSLSLVGALGGFLAPKLDRVVGPRRAVQIEIAGCLAALICLLGMRPDRILYVFAYDRAGPPVWDGPLYRTAPELLYVGLGLVIAVCVTAQYASSRTLLVRLAPADRTAAFFGLYALSGTATVWLGSALVAAATTLFHSQVAGFVPIVALMALGAVGLFAVRGGGREA